jgi:carbon-monoxide dehydrogenase large subunit
MSEYKVIGKGLPRVDAQDKVTGRAKYALDIKLPRMLYGRILGSPIPHAKILRIDTSRAKRLPGVKAVITAADIPDVYYGFILKDRSVLAREKVRYIGEPIVAVAAVDEETADEALELIQVEYQELPAIFSPEEAMKQGVTLIHENLLNYAAMGEIIRQNNICSQTIIQQGDIGTGFREADEIFEDTFTTQMVHQCYLEPHVVVCEVDNAGRITVWTSTQSPFFVRSELAETMLIPISKIKVIPLSVGGGFGGKFGIMLEPIGALLAKNSGRPVKIIMTRKEEFITANPRHPTIMKLRTGVKKDGTLTAREATLIYDTGAFAGMGPIVSSNGAKFITGPYRIPHVKVDSYCVYTNKTPPNLCRGAGTPQAVFASESHMDIIAAKLGMDPIEFRLKNGVEEGDLSSTGQVLQGVGFKETVRIASQKSLWAEKIKDSVQGKGIGCLHYETGTFGSSCCIRLNEDGTFALMIGTVEIGQGSTTILRQIAAEGLGIPIDAINISIGDTDIAPYDMGTGADRVTFSMGNAVLEAVKEMKAQLFQAGAMLLEANPEDMELYQGKVIVRGAPERGIPLSDLALACHMLKGGPILAKGSYLAEEPPFDPQTIKGGFFPSTPAPTFATQIADVRVDPETGQVEILKIVAAHDVGFAINPMTVEGQIEGGVVMGSGYALWEEVIFDQGRIINPKLADYKLPTALDAPQIEALIVEEPSPTGPFGVKGVGEPGAAPTAPAIANAIFSAVGIRIKDLPITAEKLFWRLKSNNYLK